MGAGDLHLFFESPEEEAQYLVPQKGHTEYITETEAGQQVLGLMVKAHKLDKEKYSNYHE